ncbi:MAG: hypothetical protein Ta2G_00080 [Termitinemataceae bacterium]|nr:MAG: hypothetical protein Ta2G_00080 [Termitinemataceae bacterium]
MRVFFILCFFFLCIGFAFAQETDPQKSDSETVRSNETLLDTLNQNAAPAAPAEDENIFNEEEFLDSYEGPTVDVIHDTRSGTDYVRVFSKNETVEYHYLSQIRYSELVFVLTDLLRRITAENYRWADDLTTEFEPYTDEPAIIYRIDKISDKVYGIVQFPEFKIWFSGTKEAAGANRHDALKPTVMQGLMMQFMFAMAKVEEVLGIDQMDYARKFFKSEK